MNHQELEKSKVYITSQIVEYISNSVVSKTILEKLTGNISVLSFDEKKDYLKKLLLLMLLHKLLKVKQKSL
jgi:hypothetical protein